VKTCFFIISLLLAQNASAKELRLFNSAIFGQSVNEPVKLLVDNTNGIEPKLIWTDIKEGKYWAATIFYPRDLVTMEEARASLNLVYKKYERLSNGEIGMWRNEEKKFSIQLTDEKDDEAIRVAFISFVPMNEIFTHVRKAMEILEKENAKKKKTLRTPKDSK
jgi:hypothetical protein